MSYRVKYGMGLTREEIEVVIVELDHNAISNSIFFLPGKLWATKMFNTKVLFKTILDVWHLGSGVEATTSDKNLFHFCLKSIYDIKKVQAYGISIGCERQKLALALANKICSLLEIDKDNMHDHKASIDHLASIGHLTESVRHVNLKGKNQQVLGIMAVDNKGYGGSIKPRLVIDDATVEATAMGIQSCSYTPTVGNGAAHVLAKLALTLDEETTWLDRIDLPPGGNQVIDVGISGGSGIRWWLKSVVAIIHE
ncbi:hypothetical protein Ancab_005891 [Ancistrocladus abbreviatus]